MSTTTDPINIDTLMYVDDGRREFLIIVTCVVCVRISYRDSAA